MPIYVYRCKFCNKEVEIIHSMDEVDEPTEETIEETSCPLDRDCAPKIQEVKGLDFPKDHELRFVRVPQRFGGNFGSFSKQDKISSLKKRANDHYEKEIKEKKIEMNKKLKKDNGLS